jgi:hypothetical protein
MDVPSPSCAHCNEPSARAVGRSTQDAEIPVPAQRFGGIVEGIVLPVGEIRWCRHLSTRS